MCSKRETAKGDTKREAARGNKQTCRLTGMHQSPLKLAETE